MKPSVFSVALCLAMAGPAFAMAGYKPEGRAVLADARGKTVGTATARQVSGGIAIKVSVSGLPAGTKGIHVHMVGKCEAPSFQSAGGHWNPDMKQHGRDNPMGSHHGDLPNIVISKQGRGRLTFVIPRATLEGPAGLFDTDGAALIIHEKADDYRTDPTGNSGGRIICGVFSKA